MLALVGADPSDIPYYRQNFRRAPGQVEERLDLVPEALLGRLQAEAGFTRREEIAAPGGGACRAVLLGGSYGLGLRGRAGSPPNSASSTTPAQTMPRPRMCWSVSLSPNSTRPKSVAET